MKYNYLEKELKKFYQERGLEKEFEKENKYIKEAFKKINALWLENYKKIKEIKFILIAEAPLWGKREKYIYNPLTPNSQFFYKEDLEFILNKTPTDKKEFIESLNNLGIIVVDVSPFAFNPKDTSINYKELEPKLYRQLIKGTLNNYFLKKINSIKKKTTKTITVFIRYSRVDRIIGDLISNVLIENQLIKDKSEIKIISNSSGGIDRKAFQIFKKNENENKSIQIRRYKKGQSSLFQ